MSSSNFSSLFNGGRPLPYRLRDAAPLAPALSTGEQGNASAGERVNHEQLPGLSVSQASPPADEMDCRPDGDMFDSPAHLILIGDPWRETGESSSTSDSSESQKESFFDPRSSHVNELPQRHSESLYEMQDVCFQQAVIVDHDNVATGSASQETPFLTVSRAVPREPQPSIPDSDEEEDAESSDSETQQSSSPIRQGRRTTWILEPLLRDLRLDSPERCASPPADEQPTSTILALQSNNRSLRRLAFRARSFDMFSPVQRPPVIERGEDGSGAPKRRKSDASASLPTPRGPN